MTSLETSIIGIDCATDPKKVGLAHALLSDGSLHIIETDCGRTSEHLMSRLACWVSKSPRTLLALDAPLGWPEPLSRNLIGHRAGEELREKSNNLFRRQTDLEIARVFKKTPLDIGADRIARTAHAALKLLAELARKIDHSIPLAWNPSFREPIAAIEVYPVATLISRGLVCSNYKNNVQTHVDARKALISEITQHIKLPADTRPLLYDADILDACICTLDLTQA